MTETSASPASTTTPTDPADVAPVQGPQTVACPRISPYAIDHLMPSTKILPHGTVVFRCHACGIRLTD